MIAASAGSSSSTGWSVARVGCTKVIEDRPHNWINGNVEKGETSRGSDVHLSFACCFLPLSINLHTMLCMIFTPSSLFVFSIVSFCFFFLYAVYFDSTLFFFRFFFPPCVALARSGYTCLVRSAEIPNGVWTPILHGVLLVCVCVSVLTRDESSRR